MRNGIADERVMQESHRVLAKNFRSAVWMLVLLLVVKAVGVLIDLPWYVLLPEAAGLVCGTAVWLVWMCIRGLWGAADERISSERERCMSTSWTVAHCTALLASAALMLFDRENSTVYMLTALAMTLIMYCTMSRMANKGLYVARSGQKTWPWVLRITAVTLVLCPVMMGMMGKIRQETYSLWMYILLEGIILAACLLGGVLAQSMMKRSNANAEKQLEEAEESDEE